MALRKRKTKKKTPISIPDEDMFSGLQGLLEGKPKVQPRSTGRVQLERAPNPVVFIESEKYLAGPKLNDPQYVVVRDFFELLCPICNDIERVRIKNDVPRKDQILFENDKCPSCGSDKVVFVDELYNYNELIGVVGMRGGKSVLLACISGSITHELLCVEDLQDQLGLVKSQEIDGAFVAASGEQAGETIYRHFRGFYDNSPWFQTYRKSLMDLELLDPNLRRGDLYWQTEKKIHFKDKHIMIKSLTSNSASIAGKTRIFAVIDELSRMDAGDSKRSATEVYRVLKRSLLTIRARVNKLRDQGIYNVPDAHMFCISSPIFQDDKSMQLLKQAEISEKMFAFHQTTWDFNPEITREDLFEEYETDPLGAERDYGANPPGAENPLIKNSDIIEICIDEKRMNAFEIRETNYNQKIRDVEFHYIKMEILDVRWKNLADYVVHCDPGRTADSFCIAMGHLEDDLVIIDAAIEARPIPQNNKQGLLPREVYFPAMKDIIIDLQNMLSLKFVSYDRWNSTEQIQELRENKLLAFQKDILREDCIRFVNTMMAQRIRFPDREHPYINPKEYRNVPCAKALWELKRLNDDGVRVDHPSGGSNDMVQCYIGVHRLLMHPEEVISIHDMGKINRNRNLFRKHGRKIGNVIHLPQRGSRR